jgi:micrococcal nuclease
MPMRSRLVALAVAVAACAGCADIGIDGSDERASRAGSLVVRVVDGDTAIVEIGGQEQRVRFIGIDAPESVVPGEPVECFGPEAADYTRERLEGANVRIEYDVERRDRFERTLAYVWLGDELFNETLVREGYALVTTFPPNVRYVDRFVDAQRAARARERGLWHAC